MAGIFDFLNKDVIHRFCGLFNIAYTPSKLARPQQEAVSILETFPFDFPILPGIRMDVGDEYVEFS